jgi:hypothetical protein
MCLRVMEKMFNFRNPGSSILHKNYFEHIKNLKKSPPMCVNADLMYALSICSSGSHKTEMSYENHVYIL